MPASCGASSGRTLRLTSFCDRRMNLPNRTPNAKCPGCAEDWSKKLFISSSRYIISINLRSLIRILYSMRSMVADWRWLSMLVKLKFLSRLPSAWRLQEAKAKEHKEHQARQSEAEHAEFLQLQQKHFEELQQSRFWQGGMMWEDRLTGIGSCSMEEVVCSKDRTCSS